MSIRPLLALVAAVILAMLGALWLALSDSPTGLDDPGIFGPAAEGAEVPPPPPRVPFDSESEKVDPGREEVEIAEASEGSFAIPGDALWIEGRVVFPDGTPLDEVLHVEARGRRFTDARKAPRKHTVRVQPDGHFRVAFGAETEKGFLSLNGRYLYLEEKHVVELASQESEVVLQPELGGVIAGVVFAPPGQDYSTEIRDSVTVDSWSSHARHSRRSARPGPDWSFELTALPPAPEYRVDAHSKQFADTSVEGVVVRAGEITEIEIDLTRGVRLAGRVVGPDGVGLEKVAVELKNVVRTQRSHLIASTDRYTDANGLFEFTGLRAGRITLHIRAKGFAERVEELGKLEDGTELLDLLYPLSTGLELGGRVLWPDGTPAAGVVVAAQPIPRKGESEHDVRKYVATADGNGAFRFTGLDERRFIVTVNSRSGPPIRDDSAVAGGSSSKNRRSRRGQVWKGVVEDAEPGTEGLVVMLGGGGVLLGRVTDDTGKPVSSFRIWVTPRSKDGDADSFDWTEMTNRSFRDENGEFEWTGLAEGVCRGHGTGEGIVDTVPVRVTIPIAIPLEFRAERPVQLGGLVQDPDGEPVDGAAIEVRLRNRSRGSTRAGSSASKADGSFAIPNARPGILALSATAPGWAPSPELEIEATSGEVREGLLLVLRPAARLTGEIHPDAAPIADREIDVHGRGELKFWKETYSDEAGRFSFEGLPPGEFIVSLNAPWSDDPGDDWRLQAAKRSEVVVTLTEGGSDHVVFGEPPSAAIVVRGRVTVGGKVRVGLVVQCTCEDYRTAAACDGLGNYELQVERSGQHLFEVISRSNDRGEFRRSIGEKPSQREDFDLPAGAVAGILVDPEGRPPTRVSIDLDMVDENGEYLRRLASRDSATDGSFRFDFLAPGRYRLRAAGPNRNGRGAQFACAIPESVLVEEGQCIEGLRVELGPGGMISGYVASPDGSPVDSAWLAVLDGREYPVIVAEVECDPTNGAYEVDGVPAGSFTVHAWTGQGGPAGVEVDVSVGATSRMDLVVGE